MQLQGEAGWSDLLDFYFKTKQGQEHPEDLMRRFSNLIEELGIDNFDLTNEDLEYLFNEFPELIGEEKFLELLSNADNEGILALYKAAYGEYTGEDLSSMGDADFMAALAAAFNDAYGSSLFRGSPIVLDLDQSGAIERVDLDDSQAFFDLDNDGFREHAEWVSGEDGFLARDVNGNGVIDDNSELFGDNDPEHANGWDKLREHDTNSDNVIDANDAVFEELLVWKDLDGDGFTDEGELMTLTEAGIESINLPGQGELASSFEFMDGTEGYAEDIFLELNQMHTVYNGDVDLDMEVLFLPWARGYGEVKHLPIAMSEDAELKALVVEINDLTNVVDVYHKIDEL